MDAYYSNFSQYLDTIAFVYTNSNASAAFKSFTRKQAKDRKRWIIQDLINHFGRNTLYDRLYQAKILLGTAQKTLKKSCKITEEQVAKCTRKYERRMSEANRSDTDSRAVRYILMVALVKSQWSSFHKTKEYADIYLVEDALMAPDQMVLSRVLKITEQAKNELSGLLDDLAEGEKKYKQYNCPKKTKKQVVQEEITPELINRFEYEDYYDEYQYE